MGSIFFSSEGENSNQSSNNSSGKPEASLNLGDECYVESGINSEIFKSFLSRPLDKINIPEVTKFETNFQYNYFTVDERSISDTPDNKTLVNLDIDNSDEIFYRIKTNKKPRYVKLSFKKPKVNNLLLKNSDKIGLLDEEIIDDILVEGALSNEIFTGFELIDTGREEKIYSMLKSAQTFIGTRNRSDSEKSAAERLHDVLEEKGGLFGSDKKLIVEALSGINSNNMRIIKESKRNEVTTINDEDPLGKQTFSMQFNNLLMHDVIREASRIPDNVYQDELRGLEELSKSIRDNLIASIPETSTFNELDYDLQVPAVKITPMNSMGEGNNLPEVLFVGYLVEKYQLLDNEGVVYLGKTLIQNPDNTYLTDYDVVYGRSYFYKVRTVCEVKTIVSTDNISDSSLNQSMIATIYVASEGVTDSVICEENIAPPPPTGIRATFDFKTLLPRITWQFPLNKQRDIKRFQIFKRLSINSPFILIAEYDFDNSEIRTPMDELAIPENIYVMTRPRLSFIDKTHKEGEQPIYTVACVDAHGLSSNYGPQVQVSRDRYTNKVTRKIISGPNAPKPYPNLLINQDSFLDAIKLSKYKKMKLFLDPEYYQVFKYETKPGTPENTQRRADEKEMADAEAIKEINLDFLAINPDKYTYKLQIINVDNQQDQIVNIKLTDKSSPGGKGIEVKQPAENFSPNNISFQYGI